MMDRLWSPWRMQYIEDNDAPTCPFCISQQEAEQLSGLILSAKPCAYSILNLYPYNTGHLMVIPYRHIANISEITKTEFGEITGLLQDAVHALNRAFEPTGFNVGMNIGDSGGAGIPDHLHFHVVPRWTGDTNFMPVIGETKVMPESLQQTKSKLMDVWPD